MADLTLGTVEKLLGLLTTVIKDEVELQSGVQRDIQFIKDEMDSMNGFLLHLTKTETAHNDQHRAWMKQVRDIAYIAQDCIELYMRDLNPPEDGGCLASVRHYNPKVLLRTCCKRRDLAKQLHELKDRVREVGERRLRYGVSVPEIIESKPEPAGKDSNADEKREEFIRTLEQDAAAGVSSSPPSFSTAISLLPVLGGLPSNTNISKEISEILENCGHVDNKKMFLRALYAYPNVTEKELTTLKEKLMKKEGSRSVDVSKKVMLFSYSKLSTHYKSCLQYLTAFLEEDSISRTSLVRRWVAEGQVARDDGSQSMEEAGERCFDELVFRGFIQPVPPVVPGPGLKIKSCTMEESVRGFVIGMAESENFVAGALPTHLRHQRKIREIARRPQPQQQPQQRLRLSWKCNICPRKQRLLDDSDDSAAEEKRHPMDEMARLLKGLPEEYRLNVLDLGGCSTLMDDHFKSIICKVPWLKYLSLRKTNVTRLPKEINNLRLLGTLDIRETSIQASDTKHIVLRKLKHLLAGHIFHDHNHETETLLTVKMPDKILMSMEILRYVEISNGKDELDVVGNLKYLRKLGVVVEGSKDNMMRLHRAINNLSKCLRSLSVWITTPTDNATPGDNDGGFILGSDDEDIISKLSPPKNLESLNIKYYFRSSSSGGMLPRWIEGLNQLSKVTLRDTQLPQSSLRILGKVESLRCLQLRRGSYKGAIMNMDNGEFPKLRFLLIDQVTLTTRIAFQECAAPKLEKITWTFNKKMEIKEDTISDIKYLDSLEELELNGDWVDLQGHVMKALDDHPKRRLRLTCSFPISEVIIT